MIYKVVLDTCISNITNDFKSAVQSLQQKNVLFIEVTKSNCYLLEASLSPVYDDLLR